MTKITMSRDVTIILHECWNCGVIFGLTERLNDKRREDGGSFFCPNGHSAVFKESDKQRLERELQRAQQQIARAEDEARDASRREVAAKRETARLQKRVGAGVCPCCSRTFSQLARHMQSKHPDVPFVPTEKKRAKK